MQVNIPAGTTQNQVSLVIMDLAFSSALFARESLLYQSKLSIHAAHGYVLLQLQFSDAHFKHSIQYNARHVELVVNSISGNTLRCVSLSLI